MKAVRFIGDTRQRLQSFPDVARQGIGQALLRVQLGLEPVDWKPMPSIGAGVRELRVRVASGAFRAVYVAHLGTQIVVLHAFQKKTQKTSPLDLELAKTRYKMLLRDVK
jgi:phage-related protein